MLNGLPGGWLVLEDEDEDEDEDMSSESSHSTDFCGHFCP